MEGRGQGHSHRGSRCGRDFVRAWAQLTHGAPCPNADRGAGAREGAALQLLKVVTYS